VGGWVGGWVCECVCVRVCVWVCVGVYLCVYRDKVSSQCLETFGHQRDLERINVERDACLENPATLDAHLHFQGYLTAFSFSSFRVCPPLLHDPTFTCPCCLPRCRSWHIPVASTVEMSFQRRERTREQNPGVTRVCGNKVTDPNVLCCQVHRHPSRCLPYPTPNLNPRHCDHDNILQANVAGRGLVTVVSMRGVWQHTSVHTRVLARNKHGECESELAEGEGQYSGEKFSKDSALVHLLYNATLETTFENVPGGERG